MRNDSIADFGLRILDCTRWIESILDCGMEEQSAKGIAQSVKIPLHLPSTFHLHAMPSAPCAMSFRRAPEVLPCAVSLSLLPSTLYPKPCTLYLPFPSICPEPCALSLEPEVLPCAVSRAPCAFLIYLPPYTFNLIPNLYQASSLRQLRSHPPHRRFPLNSVRSRFSGNWRRVI